MVTIRLRTIFVSVLLLATVFVAGLAVFPQGESGSTADRAVFTDVASDRGLNYSSSVYRNTGGNGNQGVYVIDYDNDGWEDVVVTGGQPSVAVFENTGGEFDRADVLPRASPAMPTSIKSVHVFDYDNDEWEDLLLLPSHGKARLLENHRGEFKVSDSGLPSLSMPLGATSFDYNRDGCLDVFIIQSGDWARRTPEAYNQPETNVTRDNGNPNLLFEGNCSGFERVNLEASGAHWSLATSGADLTGDGWPDLHVANDYFNNIVYVNQGDGTFAREILGTRTDRNGMSSELADVNRDHRPDIFVTNIHLSTENARSEAFKRYIEHRLGKRALGNVLLVNSASGMFRDRADAYGVRKGGWGWAAVITDFDNDAKLEYFHATQVLSGMQAKRYRELATPNYWDRSGDEITRRNATEMGFDATDGRGVAALDFDRDGDQDVVVANRDGDFRLFENRHTSGNWLQLRLERDGAPTVGSKVFVTINGTTRLYTANAKSDFLSQDTRTVHVGLGEHQSVDRVRVVWPDGSETTADSVKANQYVRVSPSGTDTTRSDCLFEAGPVSLCGI